MKTSHATTSNPSRKGSSRRFLKREFSSSNGPHIQSDFPPATTSASLRVGRSAWLAVLALALCPAPQAPAVEYDRDDFLIAGYESGTIGIYDRDLTFKGNFALSVDFLGNDAAYWFTLVSAMDFDEDGNLFAVGRLGQTFAWLTPDAKLVNPEPFRSLWSSSATLQMLSLNIRDGVGGFGPRFVGGFRGWVREHAGANSNPEREFTNDGSNWTGVAILPGDVLWASTKAAASTSEPDEILVFDLLTGNRTGQIRLDSRPDQPGFVLTTSMFYSELTDTVLTTNWRFVPGGSDVVEIVERNTDGSIVRVFDFASGFSDGSVEVLGVTRGPNGDVFATNPNDDRVYRWSADGTYLGRTNLSASIEGSRTILWAGNVHWPVAEPTPLAILKSRSGSQPGVHEILFSSDPFRSYIVQRSHDLKSWSTIDTVKGAPGSAETLIEIPLSSLENQEFWRLRDP